MAVQKKFGPITTVQIAWRSTLLNALLRSMVAAWMSLPPSRVFSEADAVRLRCHEAHTVAHEAVTVAMFPMKKYGL